MNYGRHPRISAEHDGNVLSSERRATGARLAAQVVVKTHLIHPLNVTR